MKVNESFVHEKGLLPQDYLPFLWAKQESNISSSLLAQTTMASSTSVLYKQIEQRKAPTTWHVLYRLIIASRMNGIMPFRSPPPISTLSILSLSTSAAPDEDSPPSDELA
ncbi:hypothetical protein L1987_38451 [Smallanthus sonchifolius]|uniref:Uncharacterized protein n=1 Tax=Smallanthus sonchifolius TaxID=185202 RepID=A0ACB9HLR8_9ASTR|nr:hypothetical protein L1987_38451 [Smallanthus sonchifolius]